MALKEEYNYPQATSSLSPNTSQNPYFGNRFRAMDVNRYRTSQQCILFIRLPSEYLSAYAHKSPLQPPREDPFTGKIYPEAGAEPYNNWNERIHAECYRPNAELGNFRRISFDIGPTLFPWLVTHDPATYRSIILPRHTIIPSCRWQRRVTRSSKLSGASQIFSTDSGVRPRACGCRKPRLTWRLWHY